MKNSNTCPFCGSTKIFIDKAVKNRTLLMTHDKTFSFLMVDRYVCLSCGHIEEWVDKEYCKEHKENFKNYSDDNDNLCLKSSVEALYKDT